MNSANCFVIILMTSYYCSHANPIEVRVATSPRKVPMNQAMDRWKVRIYVDVSSDVTETDYSDELQLCVEDPADPSTNYSICVFDLRLTLLSHRDVDCDVTTPEFASRGVCDGCQRLIYWINVTANVRQSRRRAWLQVSRGDGSGSRNVTIVKAFKLHMIYSSTVQVDGRTSSLYRGIVVNGTKIGFLRVVVCLTAGIGNPRNFSVTLRNMTRTAGQEAPCLVFPRVFVPVGGRVTVREPPETPKTVSFSFHLDVVRQDTSDFNLPLVWVIAMAVIVGLGLIATLAGVVVCHCNDRLRRISKRRSTKTRSTGLSARLFTRRLGGGMVRMLSDRFIPYSRQIVKPGGEGTSSASHSDKSGSTAFSKWTGEGSLPSIEKSREAGSFTTAISSSTRRSRGPGLLTHATRPHSVTSLPSRSSRWSSFFSARSSGQTGRSSASSVWSTGDK